MCLAREGRVPGEGAVKGSRGRRIDSLFVSRESGPGPKVDTPGQHIQRLSARSLSTRGAVQPAPRAASNPDSPVSLSEPTSQRRDP